MTKYIFLECLWSAFSEVGKRKLERRYRLATTLYKIFDKSTVDVRLNAVSECNYRAVNIK